MKKYIVILAGVASLVAHTGQEARAAFELNFQPSPDSLLGTEQNYASCNMGQANAWCQHGRDSVDIDSTPFLREYITVAGVSYVHMIVGSLAPDPVTGIVFAQETYIRASGLGSYSSSGGRPGCNLNPASRCGGGTDSMTTGNGQVAAFGALSTPLVGDQHTTGIGSGDPTSAIIRQLMLSPEMSQEFLKANPLLKPKITQSINVSGIDGLSSQFVMDMSALNYSTLATGTMVNTLTLNDPSLPVSLRFFDVSASSQSANVTGGGYTFTAGTGWIDFLVHPSFTIQGINGRPPTVVPEDTTWEYSQGGYAYSNGGADITNMDWQVFKNPLENPR